MFDRTPPVCDTDRDREAFKVYQEAQEASNDGDCVHAMQLFRRAFKMSPELADLYGM